MFTFIVIPHYPVFADRCRELADRADPVIVLAQMKGLIELMSSVERDDAMSWLWDVYDDAPPFDRVFALLATAP